MNPDAFQIKVSEEVDLNKRPTRVEPFYESKDHYEKILKQQVKELSKRQNLLYAHNQYALLLIFQAMDAAGKDSAIKNVMSGVNPQGCQVFSFKQPSTLELEHDFLWRTSKCLPERGRIGIFNRSYYEEVLVTRVHPTILHHQGIPDELIRSQTIWKERYQSILDLENHLHRNGTKIVKFFLHISKDEQRKRLLRRIDDPEKNWKFSVADIEERKFWTQYMDAYNECIAHTHTENSPWYVVPSDDKANARLIVSKVILNTMNDLKMSYPKLSKKRLKELQDIRKMLVK